MNITIPAEAFYIYSDVGHGGPLTLELDTAQTVDLDVTSDQGGHSENPVIATRLDAEVEIESNQQGEEE